MNSSKSGANINSRKTILRIAVLVIIAFYGQQSYSLRAADSSTEASETNRVNPQGFYNDVLVMVRAV